eukprot:366541-Chlamydomonas_euryale.AAC.2
MAGWTDGRWMDGRVAGGLIDGPRTDGWTDGGREEQMEGGGDRWMDGWRDRWLQAGEQAVASSLPPPSAACALLLEDELKDGGELVHVHDHLACVRLHVPGRALLQRVQPSLEHGHLARAGAGRQSSSGAPEVRQEQGAGGSRPAIIEQPVCGEAGARRGRGQTGNHRAARLSKARAGAGRQSSSGPPVVRQEQSAGGGRPAIIKRPACDAREAHVGRTETFNPPPPHIVTATVAVTLAFPCAITPASSSAKSHSLQRAALTRPPPESTAFPSHWSQTRKCWTTLSTRATASAMPPAHTCVCHAHLQSLHHAKRHDALESLRRPPALHLRLKGFTVADLRGSASQQGAQVVRRGWWVGQACRWSGCRLRGRVRWTGRQEGRRAGGRSVVQPHSRPGRQVRQAIRRTGKPAGKRADEQAGAWLLSRIAGQAGRPGRQSG